MALKFKTSEEINVELGREGGDVENLGAFKDLLPKGTKVKFGKKNLMNKTKRLTVVCTSKEGKLAFIPTSESVNNIARRVLADGKSKTEVLGWLAGLDVVENSVGMFISLPMGEASEGIEIGKLATVDSADFIPEELVAF